MVKAMRLDKALPYIIVIYGIIGSVCVFFILYEKLQLLSNPHYHPSCSIIPIISCGSVMESMQSHLLGFPNPIIGLIGFPIVTTVGVTILAGATFKRWFWLGLNAGAVLGLIFIHWLFYQSVYSIHALCPYCMVVWLVTFATFWYVTLYNLHAANIKTPTKLRGVVAFMQRHHTDIYITWVVIIAGSILQHFWYYFCKSL
jgi:uncharacterized membrane protein